MQTTDDIDILIGRENNYRFLSEIYKSEITQKSFDAIMKIDFKSLEGTCLNNGYALIKKYIDNRPIDYITDLAVDYARIFLGAGIVEKELISAPYESVYTNAERLMMQDARDKVLAIYRKHGLGQIKGFDIPEDHLATELEFMAYLASKTADCYKNNEGKKAEELIIAQREFIDNHLLNWLPKFCAEITRFSKTDFYKGIALLTIDFIEMDKDILAI